MTITVEDRPDSLLELLWIREAHGLRPQGDDLPPLLLDTPGTVKKAEVAPDARNEWERAWPRIWHAAVVHAAADIDPRLFEALQNTTGGSAARMALIRQLAGPRWRESFGEAAFVDDSYSEWSRRGMDAHLPALPKRLEDQPERRDLVALIPAWRAGLTKIVTIPCAGEFTRRVGTNALLMSAATRADSGGYRRALGAFVIG